MGLVLSEHTPSALTSARECWVPGSQNKGHRGWDESKLPGGGGVRAHKLLLFRLNVLGGFQVGTLPSMKLLAPRAPPATGQPVLRAAPNVPHITHPASLPMQFSSLFSPPQLCPVLSPLSCSPLLAPFLFLTLRLLHSFCTAHHLIAHHLCPGQASHQFPH